MTFAKGALASTAAGLAFVATLLPAEPASAAVTRSIFQQKVALNCTQVLSCKVAFIQLAGNQALEITRAVCHVEESNGDVYAAHIFYLPAQPDYSEDLGLLWSREILGNAIYTLGGNTQIRIPAGKRLHIAIDFAGQFPTGFCSVSGEKITVS
jgi:hypothetical protein